MKIIDLQQVDFKPNCKPPIILPAEYRYEDGVTYQIIVKSSRDSDDYELKIPIIRNGAEITAIIENPDKNEVLYEIMFAGGKKAIIHGADLFQKKGIMELCGYGLVVAEGDVKQVSGYFGAFLAMNSVPTRRMYSTFGWKNDGFLLGSNLYKMDGTVEHIDTPANSTLKDKIDALTAKGIIQAWINSINKIMNYDTQRFKIYIAATAPILKILGAKNVILDDFGDSGKGKSLTTEVAMSMYGNAEMLMYGGGVTPTAAEILATIFNDLPLNFDDMQVTKEEDRNKIIYNMGNGTGKSRGTKDDRIRETRRWRNITMMTSEVPLTNDESLSGLENRLIEVSDGLGVHDGEAAQLFESNKKKHYGVFAPLYIRHIINNRDIIIEKFQHNFQRLHSGHNTRIRDIYAAVLTAAELFEEVYESVGGKRKDPYPIVAARFGIDVERKGDNNFTMQGLTAITQWVSYNKNKFNIDGRRVSDIGEIFGNINAEFTDINPLKLKSGLEEKYNIQRLLHDFKNMDIISTDADKKRFTKTTRIENGGDPVKVYRFVNHKVNQALKLNAENKPQNNNTRTVAIIRKLQNLHGYAELGSIVQMAYDNGIEPETVEEIIEKLKTIGGLTEVESQIYILGS